MSQIGAVFGVVAQFFGAFDGIMIRQGEEAHAAEAEKLVNLLGIVVAFAAKFARKGGGAGTGEV